jgi:hypothetical protein
MVGPGGSSMRTAANFIMPDALGDNIGRIVDLEMGNHAFLKK